MPAEQTGQETPNVQRCARPGIWLNQIPIQLFANDIADILERVTPVFEIMRMAAKTEREIAELLSNILDERLQNLGVFVQHLSAHNDLREG